MQSPVANALDMVRKQRTRAIWNLFDTKFNVDYRITVGSATCEHAAGSLSVYETFQSLIAESGTPDISVGHVGCSGRCDMEPVVTVISRAAIPVKYVKVTPEIAKQIFERHILNNEIVEDHSMRHIEGWEYIRTIATISGAHDEGSDLEDKLVEMLEEHDLAKMVFVNRSPYGGEDPEEPSLHIYPDNVTYPQMNAKKLEKVVQEHLGRDKIVAEFQDNQSKVSNLFIPFFGDVHFYGKQLRMALRNCGVIDPESIDEYLSVRGYEAVARTIDSMTPEEVIESVKRSGLRGRGGGGFLTANKWHFASLNDAKEKFIICNADEGDPGAFMDRSIIEGDPHTIIEGMIIAGYAMQATQGFVYTRVEYPLAIKRLEIAIEDARQRGFLGKNLFGSDWSYDIEVRFGAGAFVCGEETALIQSIEGFRGEPREKPPFPTDRGLWGCPTAINNVETFANLPVILLDGDQWFSAIGTGQSKGTKVFALAGKVRNTGLIEVPMGTTLREIIYEIGGGIIDDKAFKAVQTGGPAGGCLPDEFLDTSVDYESLKEAGSIMGSGGMIVLDESTCMVDVAKFFLEFMVDESCGQCTPCRAGTKIMHGILEKITNGQATMDDLRKLEEMCDVVAQASLCGLGKCAPNPVVSTLRYFRHEYEEHILERKCRAGACHNLIQYRVIADACVGCGACRRKCPARCILGAKREAHEIIQEMCIKCGNCMTACKFDAIEKGAFIDAEVTS